MNWYTLFGQLVNTAVDTVKALFGIPAWWFKERKNFIGLMCCVGLLCVGFVMHGHVGLYFNLAALSIVLGGTFGATLLCFQIKRLWFVYKQCQD